MVNRAQYPIYFITTNRGKVASMKKWVEPLGIKVYKYRKKIDVPERKVSLVEEVAKRKALDICDIVGKPFVVQDSGFFLEAYPGYPGPDVNRVLSTLGVDGILGMLPQEKEKRGSYFEDVLAFWSPTLSDPQTPFIFKSRVHGTIAYKPSEKDRSEAWSKLWTIFIPDGFESTLAAMDEEEQTRYASEVRSNPESNCFVAFANWLEFHSHYLYMQTTMHEMFNNTKQRE